MHDLKEERKISICGRKKSITKEIRERVKESIFCPNDIGIEQKEVDSYLEFIEAWYHGERGLDKCKFYENIKIATRLLNESIINSIQPKLTFKVNQVSPVL